MEEQPSFEPSQEEVQAIRQRKMRGFLKELGRVLAFSFLGAALYGLIFGPRIIAGFADGLFIVGALLLILSLVPLLAEILGRATMSFRLGERSFSEALQEERDRSRQSERTGYLFGVSGIIVVVLSFILSALA